MNRFRQTLRYIGTVLKHKAFVVQAGFFLRVPFSKLLLHDLSKFSPAEFEAYRRQFFPADEEERLQSGFDGAWLHHCHHNPHHWQHWILNGEPLPMPEEEIREMVADWIAAGRAYGGLGNTLEGWVMANYPRMLLHPITDVLLRRVLVEAGVCMVD